jgi:ribosome-associated protein
VPAAQESVESAIQALAAADDKKAVRPVLLDVADVLGLVDLFAIVSCTSDRHVKAVSDEVERQMKQDHDRAVVRREGTPVSGWIILDYGDLVVHVFHEETRELFNLERLWRDVPTLDPTTGAITFSGMASTERIDDGDVLVEG